MSDEEYSDVEDDTSTNPSPVVDTKKHARAQHNALERRRRDNIKDMYGALKDTIPGMHNERASRAVILKRAVDLIISKQNNLEEILSENKRLERENAQLEEELAQLEQDNVDLTLLPDVAGGDRDTSPERLNGPIPAEEFISSERIISRKRHAPDDQFPEHYPGRRYSSANYEGLHDGQH